MVNKDMLYASMYSFDYDRRLKEMAEKHINISFTENEQENAERPLKGVILFEEDGRHWLHLHYKTENGDDLYIPKLALPIDQIPMIEDTRLDISANFNDYYPYTVYARWFNCLLEMEGSEITVRDNLGNPVKSPKPARYVIVKQRKKMTMADIEKELGYAIEIVEEE